MACPVHDWIFDSACPKCVAELAVTAPVTEPTPEPDYDSGDIPKWLQRNRDGSFKFPGYPLDPVESAVKRKMEYALDEQKEQGHDTSINLHGGNFPPVHDIGD